MRLVIDMACCPLGLWCKDANGWPVMETIDAQSDCWANRRSYPVPWCLGLSR